MALVFFSYAHVDEAYRHELEKHLAMLKRQGLVTAWHDRRIIPGEHIDHTINRHLENADIILFLVSSDFLASDYCYHIELRRAMERHERGEARVIPVILRPCDWHDAPFGRLQGLPRDGKPISTWADRDQAFLDVTNEIKAVLVERPSAGPRVPGSSSGAPPESHPGVRTLPASNTRIPRRYSELDKDDFLDQAFQYVAAFFENSLQRLEADNPGVTARFRSLDARRFTAVAYREGRPVSRCTIWLSPRSTFVAGIGYAENDSGETDSFNESLSVETDQDSLYLKPMAMPFLGRRHPEKMTVEAAAEYLWELFLQRLRDSR